MPCTSPCNTWSYQSQNLMGGDGDLSRTRKLLTRLPIFQLFHSPKSFVTSSIRLKMVHRCGALSSSASLGTPTATIYVSLLGTVNNIPGQACLKGSLRPLLMFPKCSTKIYVPSRFLGNRPFYSKNINDLLLDCYQRGIHKEFHLLATTVS